MLPPHSNGVPDLEQSELRRPFDAMLRSLVEQRRSLDEDFGTDLAVWSKGKSPNDDKGDFDNKTSAASAGADGAGVTRAFTQDAKPAPQAADDKECLSVDFERIEIACTASLKKIRVKQVREFVVGTLGYETYGMLRKRDLPKVYEFIGPEEP